MSEKNTILLLVVLLVVILCIFCIKDSQNWNDGICAECGGHLSDNGWVWQSHCRYYQFICDDCGAEVRTIFQKTP